MDGRIEMNLPLTRKLRREPRGGSGLACSKAGVSLSPADLVRAGGSTARAEINQAPHDAATRVEIIATLAQSAIDEMESGLSSRAGG